MRFVRRRMIHTQAVRIVAQGLQGDGSRAAAQGDSLYLLLASCSIGRGFHESQPRLRAPGY